MCDMAKPGGCNPHTKCTVCRQIMVEVKAPLFTSIAWLAVHIVILQSINATLIGQFSAAQLWSGDFLIDSLWCGVINHFVHGTSPNDLRTGLEWRRAWRQGERTRESIGLACAVSYAHTRQRQLAPLIHVGMGPGHGGHGRSSHGGRIHLYSCTVQ